MLPRQKSVCQFLRELQTERSKARGNLSSARTESAAAEVEQRQDIGGPESSVLEVGQRERVLQCHLCGQLPGRGHGLRVNTAMKADVGCTAVAACRGGRSRSLQGALEEDGVAGA